VHPDLDVTNIDIAAVFLQAAAGLRNRSPVNLPDEDSAVFTTPASPRANRKFLPDNAPFAPTELWKSMFFWNGMACYREPSSTPAYAAACNIRATPLQVFQHFVRLADGTSGWNVFEDVAVLESTPDEEADLVRTSRKMIHGRNWNAWSVF
jgi:hypothetical protein